MLTLNLWNPKAPEAEVDRPDDTEPRTQRPLLKTVVLNTKGGCGKTTLSTSITAYYASHGYRTALLDMDPQGSSLRWLANRGERHAHITGLSGVDRSGRVTKSFLMRVPPDAERLIVDTPAAMDPLKLHEVTRGAHAILIPVLPSDIDIHAASRCIADLLLAGRIENRRERVAVVANRVKKQAKMYETLRRFLHSLEIPFVATLRDSQNYIHAVEQGLGVHELKDRNIKEDVHEWRPLIEWLDQRGNAVVHQQHYPPRALTGTHPGD
ncbi:MAG TPA: ParA family protein [Gammaproteobacteria bacterium]|nr:ParA family protein [Gammaproteobacteria bacterium]